MHLLCTTITTDEALKRKGNWLEIAIGMLECLNRLPTFTESRTLKLVKRSIINSVWSQDKTPLKYNLRSTAYVDWTPKESKVPLFPIFIGCSLIASKPVSKVYSLPLLN